MRTHTSTRRFRSQQAIDPAETATVDSFDVKSKSRYSILPSIASRKSSTWDVPEEEPSIKPGTVKSVISKLDSTVKSTTSKKANSTVKSSSSSKRSLKPKKSEETWAMQDILSNTSQAKGRDAPSMANTFENTILDSQAPQPTPAAAQETPLIKSKLSWPIIPGPEAFMPTMPNMPAMPTIQMPTFEHFSIDTPFDMIGELLGDAPKEILSDRGPPVIRRQTSTGSNGSRKSITAKVYKEEEPVTAVPTVRAAATKAEAPVVATVAPAAMAAFTAPATPTLLSPAASTVVSKTLQDKAPYPYEGEILPIESFERSKKVKELAATACVPGINPAAFLQCGVFESRDDMESYLDETATETNGEGPPGQIELTMDDPLMQQQLLMQQQVMLQHRRKLGLASPLAKIGSSIRGGLGKSSKKTKDAAVTEEPVKTEKPVKTEQTAKAPKSVFKRSSTIPKSLPTSSKAPQIKDQIDSTAEPVYKKGSKKQGGWMQSRQEAKQQKRKELQQKKLRKKQEKEQKRGKRQAAIKAREPLAAQPITRGRSTKSRVRSVPVDNGRTEANSETRLRGRSRSMGASRREKAPSKTSADIDIGQGRTRSIERRPQDMQRMRSKSVERTHSTRQRQQYPEEADISARPVRKRTVIIPDDDELGIVAHYGQRKSKAKETTIQLLRGSTNERHSFHRRSKKQPAAAVTDIQESQGTF